MCVVSPSQAITSGAVDVPLPLIGDINLDHLVKVLVCFIITIYFVITRTFERKDLEIL